MSDLFIKEVPPLCSSKFFGSSVPGGGCTSLPDPGQVPAAAPSPSQGHSQARGCSNTTVTAEPGWLKALVYWLQYQLMATSFTEPLYKYKEKDPSWKKKSYKQSS
ncbi:hypothetical protein EK904_014036 [Melospiza melodia maxima]|nr:hypothetical protein EK904_014036 [Melospiza melodia maxima]